MRVSRIGVKFNPPSIGIELEDESLAISLYIYKIQNPEEMEAHQTAQDIAKLIESSCDVLLQKKQFRAIEGLCQNVVDRKNALRVLQVSQDLNSVPFGVLEQAKSVMEEKFAKNAVRPTDANFEYNKKVDFDGEEENSWDDE